MFFSLIVLSVECCLWHEGTGELAKCEVLSVVPENIRPVALDFIFVQLRKYNYRAMQPAA